MTLTTELLKTSRIINKQCADAFVFFLYALLPFLSILLAFEIFLPSSNILLVLLLKFLWLYGWSYMFLAWAKGFNNGFKREGIFQLLFPDGKILKIALILFISISLLNFLGAAVSSVVQSSYFRNLYIWFYTTVGISMLTNMLVIYLIARSIFVFVARLNDKQISVAKSFALTKNKAAEIMGAGLLAAMPYLIFLFIYKAAVKGFIGWQFPPSSESNASGIIFKTLIMPIDLVFIPWIVIIIFTSALYYYKVIDNAQSDIKS